MGIGKWVVIVAMAIAALIAPALKNLDQAYQFIQEYVGFISPGVLAIFLLGFFWKRNYNGCGAYGHPADHTHFHGTEISSGLDQHGFPDYPFLDRMSITFVLIVIIMVIMSLSKPVKDMAAHTIEIDTKQFKVSPAFIFGSVVILGILAGLYTVFW